MNTNNISISAIRFFFSALVSALVAIVLKILIINEWGMNYLGMYVLFLAIYLFIISSISFQIVPSSSKLISEEQNTKSRNKIITSTLFLGFFLSLVGFTILFLLRLPLINYYGFEENIVGLTILAVSLPIRILVITTHGIFNGLQKYRYAANSNIIDRLSLFLIAVYVIFFYGDINLIFFSYLGSTITSLIYSLIVLKNFFVFDISGLYSNIKKIFWFGLKLSSINWFAIIGQHLDVFALSFFVPIEILAIYSIALSFASFFDMIFSSFGQIILSEVSHLSSRNDYTQINKLLFQTFRLMISLGLIIWMFSLLIFEYALEIIISREIAFDQVAMVYYILSLGFILRLTFDSLDISIAAIGKPLKLFPVVFVPLIFRLCMYPLFLPLYGLISLVAIKFFAIMILAGMSYYLIKKNIGFSIDINIVITYLAVVCISSSAKLANTFHSNGSIIILLLSIFVCFLIMINSKVIKYTDYLFLKSLIFSKRSSKK